MDILRREFAPITDAAWKEIDRQARVRLRENLTARTLVDFSGPHGWELSAVNVGRLRMKETDASDGVRWGLREVQPLIEFRVPFHLNLDELDNISRGLKNPDLAGMEQAAQRAARFEELCVYHGFEAGAVRGMAHASPHSPIPLGDSAEGILESVESGIVAIQGSGLGGPFNLVLGTTPYKAAMVASEDGYPLRRHLLAILGGKILWSPALSGGILLSSQEGNFELTVGQDFSVGYLAHDSDGIDLHFCESFTFQVLEPAAAVEYRLGE